MSVLWLHVWLESKRLFSKDETELILRWLEGVSGSPGRSQKEGQEDQGEVEELVGTLLSFF